MISNLNLLTDDAHANPRSLSPLTLAFIGDTVFDLLVREMLISKANRPVGSLHKLASKMVCAGAQSDAVRELWDSGVFTEDEIAVLKRGRNAHTNRVPKNATEASYHMATGCEALFGYLYLGGESDRIKEIFALMCRSFEKRENADEQ